MSRTIRLFLATLGLSAVFSAGWLASAQVQAPVPAPGLQQDPTIISGGDIGFRIEGYGPSGVPVGKLVVRVDGQWVVPGFRPGVRPLTGR